MIIVLGLCRDTVPPTLHNLSSGSVSSLSTPLFGDSHGPSGSVPAVRPGLTGQNHERTANRLRLLDMLVGRCSGGKGFVAHTERYGHLAAELFLKSAAKYTS